MADALQEMAVFSRVVATGSLAAVEARLGVRLINRTTRSLRLTDEGANYHETCSRLLAEIEEADAAVAAGRAEPQGVLKAAVSAAFGNQHVAPLIPRFAERYPKVHLALTLSDRTVNLIDEGFDLAIRIASLEDS